MEPKEPSEEMEHAGLSFHYETKCMAVLLYPEGGEKPYEVAINDGPFQSYSIGDSLELPKVGLNRLCLRDSQGLISDTIITNAVPMLLAYSLDCAAEGGAFLRLDYVSCGQAPFFLFANDRFVSKSEEGWLLESGENKLVFMDEEGRRSGELEIEVQQPISFEMDLSNVSASNGIAILHVDISGGTEPYTVSLNGGLNFGATGAYYYPVYLGQTLQILVKDQKSCYSNVQEIVIEG